MDKINRHSLLCDQIHETYIKKNADYGDSFGKTYQSLGIISAATRITDKYNRFIELAKGNNAMVENETIIDTLLDMANYCLMTVMEVEKD